MNNKSLWTNYLVPACIYLIGLGVAINFSLSVDYTASSDGMREYELYSEFVKTGQWHPIPGITLSSCVIVIYLPAIIQRFLGTDPLLTYTMIHSLMVSFLPVVVYFLARRYVDWKYALISVGLLLAHPYSMMEPKVARLSIALTFFTLMILVMYSDRLRIAYKIPLLAACSAGIVMSHYGTAYASLFIFGVSWLVIMFLYVAKRATFNHKKDFTVALCLLIVATTVWLGIVENTPWRQASGFVENSLKAEQFKKHSQTIVVPKEEPSQVGGNSVSPLNPPSKEMDKKSIIDNSFFDVSSREWAVQAAFGKTLPTANIPQKIEWVFSWLVVLMLTYGMIVAITKKKFNNEYMVIASVSYLTIVLAVALPHISIYYSAVRVYFHALVIVGVCFVVGGLELSKMLKLKPAVVPLIILIPYVLSTSNILHQFFGLSRWGS